MYKMPKEDLAVVANKVIGLNRGMHYRKADLIKKITEKTGLTE